MYSCATDPDDPETAITISHMDLYDPVEEDEEEILTTHDEEKMLTGRERVAITAGALAGSRIEKVRWTGMKEEYI